MTDRDERDRDGGESRVGDNDRQHHSDSERPAHTTGDEDAKSTRERRRERRDSYHSTSSHRSSSSKKSKSRSKTTEGDDQADMGVVAVEREEDRKEQKQKQRDETAYGPEFLRALATAPSVDEDSPFDVIAGPDAIEFARRFVQEQEQFPPHATVEYASGPSSSESHAHTPGTLSTPDNANARKHLPPVVFALPRSAAGDAGRKVVDFYMSWRGKTKTHRLKGQDRRTGFLDSEFRRVKETLDGEWKRAGRAIKGGFGARDEDDEFQGFPSLVRAPTDPQKPPSLPPILAAYAQGEQEKSGSRTPPTTQRTVSDPLPPPSSFPINMERPPLGVHRGSVDSLTSVTSIPLLGLVRGVPVGNRVPLRVMNPGDRFSMSSTIDLDVAETPKARLPRSSPLRDGVAFGVPDDADTGAETHLVALPGRAGSDSSASSGGSSRKSKHKRRKDKDRTSAEEEERGKEKILIVLLDEKDKDKETETEKTPVKEEGSTWHGLEHRLSMRSAQKPSPPTSAHVSPWMGPLAHTDEDVTFITTPDPSDSDGSSDDGADLNWGRRSGAHMPIRSLLSAMGYLAPEARAASMSGTPSPYGSYAALPTPYNSPYNAAAAAQLAVYTSPYVTPIQISPYHSPYGVQRPIQGSPSRPQTPPPPPIYASSGTPPQQAPPWPSPGGYTAAVSPSVYPSPVQTGYASPYASAPPSIYAPAPPPLYKPAPPQASPASPYPPASPRPPLYYYG